MSLWTAGKLAVLLLKVDGAFYLFVYNYAPGVEPETEEGSWRTRLHILNMTSSMNVYS